MKKLSLAFCAAVTALVGHTAALAQQAPSSLYGEIGYVSLSVKESFGSMRVTASPGAIAGTVGYRLHPNLSVEGLAAFGTGSDDIKVDGMVSGARAKVGSAYGVFLRPGIAVTDTIDLFGRVGFMRSTLKASGPGGSFSDSDTDVAYGFGVNVGLSKTSYLQGSWTNFFDKDGVKVHGIGVAYGHRF